MRSFTPKLPLKTAALATLLVTAPFASAYAGHTTALDEETMTAPAFHGPRIEGILDQVRGVDNGIKDARQAKEIAPSTARHLEAQAAAIDKAAERTAAADHGRIPAPQYRQLLRRVDNLDQRLLADTGSGFNIGNGSDGGNYPNG